MTKTMLLEPFYLTVELIQSAPVTVCHCYEEKDSEPCEHELDPVLLVDADGNWLVGRWNGEDWFHGNGHPVEPIAWARLPGFITPLPRGAAR